MNADVSKYGASFLARQAPSNPRSALTELMAANPEKSKDDLFSLFSEEIEANPDYRRAVDWYFFVNMYEYVRSGPNNRRSSSLQALEQRQIETTKVVEGIKRKILMLELVMPNGNLMRDCTGAEMARFGNRYQRIADKVGKTKKVGDVLTEEQVQEIVLAA